MMEDSYIWRVIKAAAGLVPGVQLRRWRADIGSTNVWRHVKRGTRYAELGHAKVQASTGPISEDDIVVVYIGMDTGEIYVRKYEEFMDGRFVEDNRAG